MNFLQAHLIPPNFKADEISKVFRMADVEVHISTQGKSEHAIHRWMEAMLIREGFVEMKPVYIYRDTSTREVVFYQL